MKWFKYKDKTGATVETNIVSLFSTKVSDLYQGEVIGPDNKTYTLFLSKKGVLANGKTQLKLEMVPK